MGTVVQAQGKIRMKVLWLHWYWWMQPSPNSILYVDYFKIVAFFFYPRNSPILNLNYLQELNFLFLFQKNIPVMGTSWSDDDGHHMHVPRFSSKPACLSFNTALKWLHWYFPACIIVSLFYFTESGRLNFHFQSGEKLAVQNQWLVIKYFR